MFLLNIQEHKGTYRNIHVGKRHCLCASLNFNFGLFFFLQEMLNDYTAVLWSDLTKQFITNNISHLVSRAEKTGILAWRLELPISALTHPKMFTFFQTTRDLFYFVHMVDTNQLIIFNTRPIHERIMLPWVKCALTEEVSRVVVVVTGESCWLYIKSHSVSMREGVPTRLAYTLLERVTNSSPFISVFHHRGRS